LKANLLQAIQPLSDLGRFGQFWVEKRKRNFVAAIEVALKMG
jgi:hypothetical protein